MRWRILTLCLLSLSAAALGVSLACRDNVAAEGWTSYAPLSEHRADAYTGLTIGDATLWLGASAALAVAAVLVIVFATLVRPKYD